MISIGERPLAAQGPVPAPKETDLTQVRASGPLDALVKKSYSRLLSGPSGFGSDWDNTNEPGDGRGRWMMAMGNYGAYLGVKPPKMLEEMQRMRSMRNPHGFFGLNEPPEVIQAQASFDNSWPIQWGIDYTRHFGDPIGLEFARGIADSFYVPRTKYFAPYKGAPEGHWMGEFGHSGVGLGGMVAVAKLALATGEKSYADAARGLADLFLDTKYEGWHGHCTSTAVLGLTYVYQLTGDSRYLEAAMHAVDSVFLGYELPYLGHTGGLYKGCDHSEGCGVSDYFFINLRLGQLTGQARYFDRAEEILWGPLFHHIRPSGGMGVDGVDETRTQLKLANMAWAYNADMCCTMWAANGLVRAFTHSVLAEDHRLTLPLYFPFTAAANFNNGCHVKLAMDTSYPNDGHVKVRIVETDNADPWTLRFRIPAWSRVTSYTLNGKTQPAEPEGGWLEVRREWRNGDEVALNLPLRVWLSRPNTEEVLTAAAVKSGSRLSGVRLFRGPLLLAIDKERNRDLDWSRKSRFVLALPDNGRRFALRRTTAGTDGFDPAFLYPRAHLSAAVTRSDSGAQQDASQPVVLTPIAEAPGRLGESPEAIEKRVIANREAVVFDVDFAPVEP